MSTPHGVQPLSNSVFVSGGLYPGGTGRIKQFAYVLWDYNGKMPPNSQVAVKMVMTPLDGSNDGKDVEHYWGVGSAENIAPDHGGGFLLPVPRAGKEPVKGISDNCNWHQAVEAFVKNCGLDPNKWNGPSGIRVMEASEITVARVDQKAREFADQGQGQATAPPANAPGGQGQQQQTQRFKPTTLVPTRFNPAWEARGAARAVPVAVQVPQAAPAATPGPTLVPPAAAAAAPIAATATANGTGDANLVAAITKLLTANPDGVNITELAKLVTEQMTLDGIGGKARAIALRSIKDEPSMLAFAAANNLTCENGVIWAN